MKYVLVALLMLVWHPVRAETRLEMAKAVTDLPGLRRLADSGFHSASIDTADITDFCEGVFEPPGFYFLSVPLTFGILSSEAFVFQGTREHMILRAHLPARAWVWRRAEWVEGVLVISEQPYTGIAMTSPEAEKAWYPIIELLP